MTANHLYKPFWCWNPDNQDEEDGREFEDTEGSYAAEQFARWYYDREPSECGDGFDVCVRDQEGDERTYTISIDWHPTFYAYDASEP